MLARAIDATLDTTTTGAPAWPTYRMLHDGTVLVELEKITQFPGSPVLAQVKSAFGSVVVPWCGAAAAEPGECYVEWTVDEEFSWGRSARPATGTGPEIRSGSHRVVLRGQLISEDDGVAVLRLGDADIWLEIAGPVPDDVFGTWVEVTVEREKIALYPYQL